MDLDAISSALAAIENNPDATGFSKSAKALWAVLSVHPDYHLEAEEWSFMDELLRTGVARWKPVVSKP